MGTFREIVYMCADQLKLASDDSFYTTDHILYMIKKYRGFLLFQKYGEIKKDIPDSNYQTICLDLVKSPLVDGEPCTGGYVLKSKEKVPELLKLGNPEVYPIGYYNSNIVLVSKERMKYVGYNRWLQNFIYCSLAPDNYLYFNSPNPQFLQLEQVKLTGIFEDADKAAELSCDKEESCDVLDTNFPLEEALIPQLIEGVIKFMLTGLYKPVDNENNDKDDLSSMMTFIRNNMKSDMLKKLES